MLKNGGVENLSLADISLYKYIIFFGSLDYEHSVNKKLTFLAPFFYSRKGAKKVDINLFGKKFTEKPLDKIQRVVRNLIARSIESLEFFQSPSLPEFR